MTEITLKLKAGPETAAVTTALKHLIAELGATKGSAKAYIVICEDLIDRVEDELMAATAKEMLKEAKTHPGWVGQRGGMISSPGHCPP
jgi:predicted DNA-binding protein